MTVRELIERLKEMDPEARVVRDDDMELWPVDVDFVAVVDPSRMHRRERDKPAVVIG